MRPRKKIPSRRCSECPKWFAPDPRAVKTQQACSKRCRLARRRRQGKTHRTKDLECARRGARERQRRCREEKRKRLGAGPAAPDVALPEGLQRAVESALELALRARRPSRAALAQALTRLAREAQQQPAAP